MSNTRRIVCGIAIILASLWSTAFLIHVITQDWIKTAVYFTGLLFIIVGILFSMPRLKS